MLVDDEVFSGVEGLCVPQVQTPPVLEKSHLVNGGFVRGPLPLAWWSRACKLSGGKALATALAIWFAAGLRGRKDNLKLTSTILNRFGVDRHAKYRALKALEGAGLIRVERPPRKNPLVTIVED